ncbi:tripartite tricarboxylate transporter TctB family protein [Afifella sp. IM 167]|uniref:tripartite tricarboxylate transporter TctB family protein n=1 Tax=Afifella sp. IM 167 TaxID=2033586 RepID=UPI001CCF9E83|nr:tripartite tricarboxylate transporter TctB family protein [Afifella sp. IM 167]
MSFRRTREFAVPVALLGVCAILAGWLIPSHVTVVGGGNGLSPRFFPYVLTAALALLATMQLASLFRGEAGEEDSEVRSPVLEAPDYVAALSLFAYFAAIVVIGMVPASFLALAAYMRCFRVKSWWKVLVYAAAVTAVLVVFFQVAASVQLPRGMLGRALW